MKSTLALILQAFTLLFVLPLSDILAEESALCLTIKESDPSCTIADDLTILTFSSAGLTSSEVPLLIDNLISENADVICIENCIVNQHTYDLYATLHDLYMHSVYLPPSAPSTRDDMLIVSKAPLELSDTPTTHRLKPHFIGRDYHSPLSTRHITKLTTRKLDLMTHDSYQLFLIKQDRDSAGGSVRIDGSIEWGGSDGPQYRLSVEGKAHDDHGNQIGARISHDFSEQRGQLTFSGSTREDKEYEERYRAHD